MFSEKQWILIRGSIAARKLIDGIEEAISAGEYEKVLGENPPTTLVKHFALKARFGMKDIIITTYKKTIMLGFFTLYTEENFISKEEADNIRRLCHLNKLLIAEVPEKLAIKETLEKFPLK